MCSSDLTARAKPDGYFLGFASLPALNTIILDPERKALFDLNSFVPIINQVIDQPGLEAGCHSYLRPEKFCGPLFWINARVNGKSQKHLEQRGGR